LLRGHAIIAEDRQIVGPISTIVVDPLLFLTQPLCEGVRVVVLRVARVVAGGQLQRVERIDLSPSHYIELRPTSVAAGRVGLTSRLSM